MAVSIEETPQDYQVGYEEEARGLPAEPRQEMLPQLLQSAPIAAENEDDSSEWEIRLTPPPMPQQKLKVKLNFTGYEAPRIAYDPEFGG